MSVTTAAYAVRHPGKSFGPFLYETKALGDGDVHIRVKYCGLCHSDIHQARGEWGSNGIFPMVPGHEVVGVVEAVGKNVKNFAKGDRVGVGCMVDSCLSCAWCKQDEEQHCLDGMTPTYNGKYKDGTLTYGGYGRDIVVREEFVLRWPESLPMDSGAPLLCAGITTWQPYKRFGADKPGKKVAVIGCGGLGHVAIMLGVALGCEVVCFSRTDSKKKDVMEVLKAADFVDSSQTEQMKKYKGYFDLVIDTPGLTKDLDAFLALAKTGGVYCTVGVQGKPVELPLGALLSKRVAFAPSLIGGVKATQEMLDFCAEKNVRCLIETIKEKDLDEAYDRVVKAEVRYRFVLDVENSAPDPKELSEVDRK